MHSYGGLETLKRLRKEHTHCIGDERIPGDSGFVENALTQDKLLMERASYREQQGWTLNGLVVKVFDLCEAEERQLLIKTRANSLSTAKSLICFWGTHEFGFTMRKIANHLEISQPAVSKSVKRGKRYCEEHELEFEVVVSKVIKL